MSGSPCSAAAVSSAVAGIGSKRGWVRYRLASLAGAVIALPLVLACVSWKSRAAETNSPPPTTSALEETNAPAPLDAYLQLQQQLQAIQLAVEQNRQQAAEVATQSVEVLFKGVQGIQQAFSAQRAQDMEAMRGTNRVLLIVIGLFAIMGFLTLVMVTCFQRRMNKALADISAALPWPPGLAAGFAAPAAALVEQPRLGRPETMEQTARRTRELEQNPSLTLKRRKGLHLENRLFPGAGNSFRRRQFRALKAAVIVGLISAAVMALLLYVLTSRKGGAG